MMIGCGFVNGAGMTRRVMHDVERVLGRASGAVIRGIDAQAGRFHPRPPAADTKEHAALREVVE
jgi:hypothetical protein